VRSIKKTSSSNGNSSLKMLAKNSIINEKTFRSEY
jgi:hypothetical protein